MPNGIQPGEDLQNLRDRWKNWADVLSRIKQDEQRWMSILWLLSGGLFAVALGEVGKLPSATHGPGTVAVVLLAFWMITHLIAWAWTRQSLVIRKQYYRSMAEIFLTQIELGWNPPDPWKAKWALGSAGTWRKEVTRPEESKRSDMYMLSGMVVVVNLTATGACFLQWSTPRVSEWSVAVAFGVLSLTGFLWVWPIYDILDRRSMKRLYGELPIRECRRRATACTPVLKEWTVLNSNPYQREVLSLIGPPALGDSVISTCLVNYILRAGRCLFSNVSLWTKHQWLFKQFLRYENFTLRTDDAVPAKSIDLQKYLDLLPHRRIPRRHHCESMLGTFFANYNGGLKPPPTDIYPVFEIDPKDCADADAALQSLRDWIGGRHLIWVCKRSTTENRNPIRGFWLSVARLLKAKAALVELLGADEEPIGSKLISFVRLNPGSAASLMLRSTAGIAVDTFGLHLAAAVGFSRVVAVLGSSDPTCVCYPGNRAVYRITERTSLCQPCGNHGYNDEGEILRTMPCVNSAFRENRCLFEDIPCLLNITPEDVVLQIRDWLD